MFQPSSTELTSYAANYGDSVHSDAKLLSLGVDTNKVVIVDGWLETLLGWGTQVHFFVNNDFIWRQS